MTPASFTSDLLHPDRINEDDGSLDKLFVRLVYDLFRDVHPALSYHDGGGKDGAIDLWNDAGNERHVFECKQFGVGKKGLVWEAAQSSWKKVQKNLEKNLLRGHDGCQSQYRPWFNSNPRIVRYTFIVSCTINPSPDRLDELRKNIKSAFEELSVKSGELSHLRDIVVDVVDWNALRRKLEAQPQVHFKWFSNRLLPGLRQFTQNRQLSDFRKYQQENFLPYYSLRAHLEKHPRDGIPDEDILWKSLAGGAAGLVISGVSGVGKSRLMMELGKLAIQDGWLVFECISNVEADTIDRVSRTHSSQGILFLLDYLENLPTFRDISLHIAQLTSDGRKVRFIASARESFVVSEQIFDESMLVFPHSPEQGEYSLWWNTYRVAAVEHIKRHLGIEMKSDLSANIPAVAVLESVLLRSNNSPADAEFAKNWADRHLATLRNENISQRCLALVAAQCPFDEDTYACLSGEPRDAFVVLINSGWIEARDTETGRGTYCIVHNYLADQIVLHWMETGPRGLAKSAEIRELLKLAYSLNTLGSVIATLQRIVGKVNGFGLDDFSNLLGLEIAANRDIWKMHRQDVLYTRLLSPQEKVPLLFRLGNYWHGAESESWFQLEIAVLAKAFANTPELKANLPKDAWEHFETLIVSLVSAADERNMLVTYGLRLLPKNDRLQQVAMDWLGKFADHFDATYIIRAWLDTNLPCRKMEQAVGVWLSRFGKTVDAQFVLAAWLRVAEESGITRFSPEIMAWCEIHKTKIVAQHVYSAWLEAGGSTQSISAYVLAWFAQNGSLEEEPSFLIKRWLRAGGKATLILPYLKEWLGAHGSTDSASYVYSAAIDIAELRQLIQEPMLKWISTHPISAEAKHCLIEWLRAGHDLELVSEHVRNWLDANGKSLDAGEVIGKWLEAKGKLKMILPYAMTWLAEHIDTQYCSLLLKALLERENAPDEVLAIALRWLESRSRNRDAELVLSAWLRGHHDIKNIQQTIIEWCQSFPTEVNASYIYEQWLLAGGSHQAVSQNIMAWLEKHDRESGAGRVLAALARPDIPWDLYLGHLKHWIECNSRNKESTFFYCAWLAGVERKPMLIQNGISAWLENNAEWKDAYCVLNDWLRHDDASTEIVQAGYKRWMAVHEKSPQAKIVSRNWAAALERERKALYKKIMPDKR